MSFLFRYHRSEHNMVRIAIFRKIEDSNMIIGNMTIREAEWENLAEALSGDKVAVEKDKFFDTSR